MEEVERLEHGYPCKDYAYHFDRVNHRCSNCGTERMRLVTWRTPVGQLELFDVG
jgi:hypothetical protein